MPPYEVQKLPARCLTLLQVDAVQPLYGLRFVVQWCIPSFRPNIWRECGGWFCNRYRLDARNAKCPMMKLFPCGEGVPYESVKAVVAGKALKPTSKCHCNCSTTYCLKCNSLMTPSFQQPLGAWTHTFPTYSKLEHVFLWGECSWMILPDKNSKKFWGFLESVCWQWRVAKMEIYVFLQYSTNVKDVVFDNPWSILSPGRMS